MHCFTLCFFIQQFILEIFSFSTQRAYNQKSSGSGKPRAQQMTAVYQHRLSGGSWARASCQNSSPVSTLACVLLLRTLSQRRSTPYLENQPTQWTQPTRLPHDEVGLESRRDSSKVRQWSQTELEFAGLLHSGPKSSPLYHLCHKLLGTCHCLQSNLQIPVSGTSPNLEGSGLWDDRKKETLVIESENLGSRPEPSLGPVPSSVKQGSGTTCSPRNPLRAPKSLTSTF